MDAYLADQICDPPRKGFFYIERASKGKKRRGLITVIDLEEYSWEPGARSRIRSTEGPVVERLPPRMAIRRGAALECSHVLLLIDDEEDTLLPSLGERAKQGPLLYDTPLMGNGGSVSAWFLGKEADWAVLANGLETLAKKALDRYGEKFLFAVGDGNHSLASAKAVWEEYKAARAGEPGLMNHPARWAMVEVENLYDPAIRFEPIHRVLFGPDQDTTLSALRAGLPGFTSRPVYSAGELSALVSAEDAAKTRLGLIGAGGFFLIETENTGKNITEGLQPLLDSLMGAKAGAAIDYIHGEEALFQAQSGVGLLLPPINKRGLFKTVARGGPLPRKSFSMGEAEEKRFYLELRSLRI
jgi:hypothetical protein